MMQGTRSGQRTWSKPGEERWAKLEKQQEVATQMIHSAKRQAALRRHLSGRMDDSRG